MTTQEPASMKDSMPALPLLSAPVIALACLAGSSLLAGSAAAARPYGPGTSSAAAHMASTAAMTCQALSPGHTVALLELFTSQGCSSCPPADRWLQSLKAKGVGLDKVVPLSLHIDIWDSPGWKDPYAQARFTERQREHVRQRRAASVYTPQVVLAGAETRDWGDAALSRTLKVLSGKPAPVRISLEGSAVGSAVRIRADTQWLSSPPPSDPGSGAAPQLQLIVFESALKNPVTGGENSGASLTHDHVVRHWLGPRPLGPGKASVSEIVSLAEPASRRTLGVAGFVQSAQGDVLQATACVME
jgi:hypothetical protein